jgi:protein associated with RNAse G/E
VRSCKYDGALQRSWPARLVRREGALVELYAEFAETIHHALLGTIERGTLSFEYYWLDRWYNIFRFSSPDGALRNFYCNVNQPPLFDGHTLSYVDLDIDVLVAPDFSYKILDENEFAINAARYNYSEPTRFAARHALTELIELIETRRFPFAASNSKT